MKNKIKTKFIFTIFFSSIFFQFGEARADINLNEVDNNFLCKGKTSCIWLKQACTKEDDSYTLVDEYEKCVLPSVTQIDDFTVASSNLVVLNRKEIVPNRRAVIPNRQEIIPNRQEIVPNRRAIIPNRQEIIPNRRAIIPNRQEIIPNRRAIIPNRQEIVPNRRAIIPNRQEIVPNRPEAN